MSQELQNIARSMRAREHYPYIDTVLVGPNAGEVDGWYENFSDLGNVSELNFFNMRNEASVGAAYCNQDNEGDLDVGYEIESIGVEVLMPPISGKYFTAQINYLASTYGMFVEMLNYMGFKFYIGQDEIVNGPLSIFPAGTGSFGQANAIRNGDQIDADNQFAELYQNGWPDFKNRWEFSKAKEIPRNRNIKAVITIPEIARYNLARMDGPGHIQAGTTGGISGPGWIPARVGFRVTLNGTRIVQLRNVSSYY